MKIISIPKSIQLAVALAGLSTLFAAGAKADCGILGNHSNRASRLGVSSAQMQALKARVTSHRDAPQDAQANPSITGLWLITFTADGQLFDEGFDAWHADGLEILNDTPPPATGNICIGTWVQTDSRSFQLTHPSWTFDDNGNLNGIAVLAEQITLDPSGASFSGTFTGDLFDLNNNNIGHIDGQVSADRITVGYSPAPAQ